MFRSKGRRRRSRPPRPTSSHPYISGLTVHAVAYVLGPDRPVPQGDQRRSGRRRERGRPEWGLIFTGDVSAK